jgi:hypothetical protein
MKAIFGFFIFCLVLFLYLHIQFHLKTSDDLEMYEIDSASKDKFEEICNLRQPVLFDFDNYKIVQTSSLDYLASNYSAFEIKIRNSKDQDYASEIYMPLPLHAAVKLFNDDKNSSYFTENNTDFLQETAVFKNLQYNDEYLRPYMVSNCNYDIMSASQGTQTPFRYEINYRNYFLVTQGSVQVKLAPPKSARYLHPTNDYENFEFRSPVNPWKTQPQYTADFDKIKCLEFTLNAGKTLYIPAYWWYSIQFNKNASISCFRYRTYMNNLAILPQIAMYGLQIQNVKRNVAKKASLDELKTKTSIHEIITDINETNNENDNNNNNDPHHLENDGIIAANEVIQTTEISDL